MMDPLVIGVICFVVGFWLGEAVALIISFRVRARSEQGKI